MEGIVHSVQPIRMAALKQWWPAGEHGIIISNFVVVNTCKGIGYTDDIRAKNFFDTTDPAPTQGKRLRLSLLIGNTEPFGPDRKRWREVGWRKQSAVECTATAAPSGQAWAERLAQAPLEIAAQLVDWEGCGWRRAPGGGQILSSSLESASGRSPRTLTGGELGGAAPTPGSAAFRSGNLSPRSGGELP